MPIGQFVRRALDVPFVPRGRSWQGWDCWGLVLIAHREVLGIDLPSYEELYEEKDVEATQELGDLVQSQLHLWTRVAIPRMGDVALLRVNGLPTHVGFMLDRKRMIHALAASKGSGAEGLTVVQRIDREPWVRKLLGVWRRGR